MTLRLWFNSLNNSVLTVFSVNPEDRFLGEKFRKYTFPKKMGESEN
jgi:hypothetical protein